MSEPKESFIPNINSFFLQRKIWHLAGTSIIPTAYYLETVPRDLTVIIVAFVTAAFVTMDTVRIKVRRYNEAFNARLKGFLRKDEQTCLVSSSYVLMAATGSLILFRPEVACAAIYYSAIGDPAACVIGKGYGRFRLRNGKSWEGAVAMFAACSIFAVLMFGFAPVWIAGALAATAIELFTGPVDDNLSVPLGAGAVMALYEASL